MLFDLQDGQLQAQASDILIVGAFAHHFVGDN